MATADHRDTTRLVRQQYEMFPYPARDPDAELKKIWVTNLEDLPTLNHYLFAGKRDFRDPFRALAAGGGTGDATIFLARQLRHTSAEIVYLDLSDTAMQIARQRARRLGLEERIQWISGSLLDLPRLGLAPVDYINCSGVLHHLDEPEAGLNSLLSCLKDDGGLGLMVYGRYGRTGVYPIQRLMRLINSESDSVADKLQNLREVLAELPETNWLRRGPPLMPTESEAEDGELYDLYLHAQDRPYSVTELYKLLDSAGLKLVRFTRFNRMLYEKAFLAQCPALEPVVDELSPRERAALAELFWGTIRKHEFWATRLEPRPADPRDLDYVPEPTVFFDEKCGGKAAILGCEGPEWQYDFARRNTLTISVKLKLTPATRLFVELLDGRRSTRQIIREMAERLQPPVTEAQLVQMAVNVIETMLGLDLVALRHESVAPLPWN